MSTATFIEQGHIYEVDGVVIPSVTQVLTLAGIDDVSMVPLHHLERARTVGTAVHQACEFFDQDDLDLASLDPVVTGYVLGYVKFREETGFVPDLIEYRMIADGSTLKYGMCVDRTGILGDRAVLLDIKTASKPSPSWAIQTAAYGRGLLDAAAIEYDRAVVHVSKEGKYKVIPFSNPMDGAVWEAALAVAHWRLAHGAKLK